MGTLIEIIALVKEMPESHLEEAGRSIEKAARD
jgi:hypothetical protein